MPKRRSPLDIRIEILEKAMENIKPTSLMYATRLNWDRMNEDINGLKTRGLIEEIEMGEDEIKKDRRTRIKYHTTATGANILKRYKEVKKIIV